MSNSSRFYQKNKASLEDAFDAFSEDATLVQELTGGDTNETPIQVIVSRRNSRTYEDYVDFDVQIRAINRDLPADFELGDTIRLERTGELFNVNGIDEEVVATRLECTGVSTI